jgi:cation:H+ antiporter
MSAPMLAYTILAAGFGLLALGGETFLRGAIGLSKALGFSPLVIGLVVVAIGATLPQLSIALQAVALDKPDIAVASIVGANIFNILLVLGLAAIIRAVPGPPKVVFRDGGAMLVASLALVLVATSGGATRRTGIVLFLGFLIYLVLSFVTDWRRPVTPSLAENRAFTRKHAPRVESSVVLFVFGLVCLYFGGQFTVDGTVAVARIDQVSEVALGLTLVAAGAALPALVAIVAASARGLTNVVAGQLIGANALNVLFVLGLTALLHPLSVPRSVAQTDVYVAVASAGVVVAMMLPGWRITRGQGAILLVCYGGYLAFLGWRQGLLGL